MNPRFILLFFLAVAAVTVPKALCKGKSATTKPAAETPGACVNKNAYTKALFAFDPLLIRNSSTTTTTKCPGEWNIHGTCCEEVKIAEFVAQDSQNMTSELADMVAEVTHLKDLVNLTLNDIDAYLRNPEYQLSSAKYKQEIIEFKNVSQLLKSAFGEFRQSHLRCQAKLKDIKAKSICPICSKRSPSFFRGTDLRMTETTCRDILTECDDAWIALMLVLRVSSQYEEFKQYEPIAFPQSANRVTRGNITNKVSLYGKSNLFLLNKLKNYATRSQLEGYLVQCKGNFAACPFQIAADLCHSFVELIPTATVMKYDQATLNDMIKRSQTSGLPKIVPQSSQFTVNVSSNGSGPAAPNRRLVSQEQIDSKPRRLFKGSTRDQATSNWEKSRILDVFGSPDNSIDPFNSQADAPQGASSESDSGFLPSPFGVTISSNQQCANDLSGYNAEACTSLDIPFP